MSSDESAEPSENRAELVAAIEVDQQQRTEQQSNLIHQSHLQANSDYLALQTRRDLSKKNQQDLQNAAVKVMVMGDQPSERETFVLTRGLYNKPGEKVARAFPAFLPLPSGNAAASDTVAVHKTPNRLALANWLVDDRNPLTARVTVNRFWQQLFGIGLVKTSEDFGSQGEIPIYQDLLDWLASDFRDNGWDVKRLIRLIVTSHTYRQSSQTTSDAYQRDPDNRLLARGARYRMPAWMLRDQALHVSGLLSSAASGPAVNTYQPTGVWEETSFGKKKYSRDDGEKLYRRSLYVFWRRIIAPTMFFDSASRQTCSVKTARTNTPLHALLLMNDVIYVEAARGLAQIGLLETHVGDKQRLQSISKRVLARELNDDEVAIFIGGLARSRQQFAADADAATKFLAIGESPREQTIDDVEHAAWTALCLGLLNLDETLTRE